jgi:hypothetical protein
MLLESGDLIVGRKCVGLDVPNLIIFISKNGEKNHYKLQKKMSCFFSFSGNNKIKSPSSKISPLKKIIHWWVAVTNLVGRQLEVKAKVNPNPKP